MPFQHKIDARVHVAGERIHRGGHFFAGGDHRPKPLLQSLLQVTQPGKAKSLNGAYHRSVRGFQQRGNLHRRLLHHRFAVFIDVTRNLQQARRELVPPRAKAVAIDINPGFVFSDHCDVSGSGRPAICDCTWAAIRPKEAKEFEMASSREIST